MDDQRSAGTDANAIDVPAALRPSVWRAIVYTANEQGTIVTIGPAAVSSAEAHAWTRRRRRAAGRPRIDVVLSDEIRVLDGSERERGAIQARTRGAVKAEARRRAENFGDATITRLEALTAQAAADDIATVAKLVHKELRKHTVDGLLPPAERQAAWTLLGMDPGTVEIVRKRRWPAGWTRTTAANDDRRPAEPTAAAVEALLEWRDTKGTWPEAEDEVAEWHRLHKLQRERGPQA